MQYTNILIVDDSATSRMIIKRCFEIAGFSVAHFIEAEDGIMAVSLFENNEIDLVVTDIRMPKMDGVTFVKKLKIIHAHAPLAIIVATSLKNEPLEKELIAEGVIGIIHKPISPEKVLKALSQRGEL